jgi:hypothetical protein
MGYYSNLDETAVFKSAKTAEQLNVLLAEATKKNHYLERYIFEDTKTVTVDKSIILQCINDEYYAKHYGADDLADFIAEYISPGSHTLLAFKGDDGDAWGYLIFSKTVLPLRPGDWVVDMPGKELNGLSVDTALKCIDGVN